jgi:hypothetical protein
MKSKTIGELHLLLISEHYKSMIIINIFINNKHDTITNYSIFKKIYFFHEVISNN